MLDNNYKYCIYHTDKLTTCLLSYIDSHSLIQERKAGKGGENESPFMPRMNSISLPLTNKSTKSEYFFQLPSPRNISITFSNKLFPSLSAIEDLHWNLRKYKNSLRKQNSLIIPQPKTIDINQPLCIFYYPLTNILITLVH